MEIHLTAPQTEFTKSNYKFPLFVAGFGSGKSTCLVVNALNDLQFPKANIGLYAPTYDLINLILVPYIEEILIEADIPYRHNKSNHTISVEGYGDMIMRSMDNPRRIVGYQVFRSHIDEIDTIPEKQATDAWNKIIARNRQRVFKLDGDGKRIPTGGKYPNGERIYEAEMNRVSAYTTPEGFSFCYKRWEKNKKPGYGMVRASTYSNPYLPEDYIDSLKDTYPPQLFDAYVHGFFVNLTSGAVYPNFDRVLNHSDEVETEDEDLHIGMDFNVQRGASSVHVLRNDLPVQVGEIFNAYDTDEQIKTIQERYPRNTIYVYPDASGTHRTSSNVTETDIAKLENAGFTVIHDYSNPAIKDRVFSLSAMICNAHGDRRWKINTNKCPNTVECLEQQVWSETGLPDKKAGLDHAPDSIGYYIWQKFPIVKPEPNVVIARGGY